MIINRIRLAAVVAGLALCAAPGFAQETYSLKRVYKAGQTDRYRTEVKMTGDGPNGALDLNMTVTTAETVREIKDDGTVVVETKVESGKATFNGTDRDIPASDKAMVTTFDKTGKVVKQMIPESDGQHNFAVRLLNLASMVLTTEKPLKAGEELKFEASGTGRGANSGKGVLTVIGSEKKSADLDSDAVKVKVVEDRTISGAQAEINAHLETTRCLEIGTGKDLRIVGEGTLKGGPLDAKVTITRVRLRDDKK